MTGSTDLISKDQIQRIAGKQVSNGLVVDLNNCLMRYQINTVQRMRHFVSQCCHESGGLTWFLEFASGANYEGRKDLGNTHPGDGIKFKGAGAIQVTGRFNAQMLSNAVGDAEIMRQGAQYIAAKYPFTSAGQWWKQNNMNELCDRSDVTVKMITKRVNGGYNGLDDRIRYYQRACEVIK